MVMVDGYRERPAAVGMATPELRLSTAGVLAVRDERREPPQWTSPHWTVVLIPAGDRSHHVGQHLPDQAVAMWSVLVRRDQAVDCG